MGIYVSIFLRVLIAVIGVYVICLISFKPWSVKGMFIRTFGKFLFKGPEMLTALGILEKLGYHRHNAKLNNGSIAHEDKMFAFIRKDLSILKSYNKAKMKDDVRLSTEIMEYFMENASEGEQWRFHDYPVNQMFGVQSSLPNLMMTLHPLNHKADVRNYAKRLGRFGERIDQEIEGLKHRKSLGCLPPKFVIKRVLDEMEGFISHKAEDNPIHKVFMEKLNNSKFDRDFIDNEGKKVVGAINDTVYPAYQRLIDLMKEFYNEANADNGVWALPKGDEYYKYCLKTSTTTSYSPEEIHEIGIKEVERIESAMTQILEEQGHSVQESPTKVLSLLAKDQRFQYSNDAEGRESCLEDYRRYIDEINLKIDDYFSTKPKMALKIERIPEFKEKTAPGAYYMRGDISGSRPGVFYVNLRDMKETRKYEMKTLAYHEGVPGHHFQIAIASELKNIPHFRRMIPFTAYAEGWAMYTEELAREMGMYDGDPYGLLGSYDSELFRAVRLVVDTGIHYKRWTREEAIDYMSQHTASAYESVVSEIERYFVMPGQACSYKIGMIKMLELREKTRKALGERFCIKEWHDIVLRSGSVPLDILEGIVDKYLASK